MIKHVLALSTALTIFAITPAFAQTATTTVDCTQQANKNDPACLKQNNTSQTQGQSGAATSTTNAQTSTVTQVSGGELIVPADRLNNVQVMSANDYIGKTVYDQAGNNIGDVNDLIISQDGKVQAVILGVGGFLGIGEKDVAVNTNAIQVVQDGDSRRLVVEATKEALNNAPTYDRNNRRYAVQQGGSSTDTTGSTTAPATNDATGNTTNSVTVDCNLEANKSNPACANQTQQQQ